MPTSIKYVKGDATAITAPGIKYLLHVCNDITRWGRGFVMAVSARWQEPEREYRAAGPLPLGTIQKVKVADDLYVINMIGQQGVGFIDGMPPVRYRALEECLDKVAGLAIADGATVHGPRFGAGLAGGDWSMVENLILDTLCRRGIQVTIYDLP